MNYGFKIRETFSSFIAPEFFHLQTQKLKYRKKTADVSAFVNVKKILRLRHTFLLLNANNKIYLKKLFRLRISKPHNNKNMAITLWTFLRFQKNKIISIRIGTPHCMENISRCFRRRIGGIITRGIFLQLPQTQLF